MTGPTLLRIWFADSKEGLQNIDEEFPELGKALGKVNGKQDIIEEMNAGAEWSPNLHLTPKKDTSEMRLWVDHRGANEAVVRTPSCAKC